MNAEYPQLVTTVGRDDLALIHVLRLDERPESLVETVDSIDPRYPREEKSVIIISTQLGCPVRCLMCDAAAEFHGNLGAEQMLAQVRFVLARRPAVLGARKLKVHFARMGEPTLNRAVLEALEELPALVGRRGLIACLSTMAPAGSEDYFEVLRQIKERCYAPGHFQLQFSINSTDPATRQRLIPFPLLGLDAIAALAAGFHLPGDRRVVLNFALARGSTVDVKILRELFDPRHFMVKLTPVNPTERARRAGLETLLSAEDPAAVDDLVAALRRARFETVVSIGEPEEILIGSNCGQAARKVRSEVLPGA